MNATLDLLRTLKMGLFEKNTLGQLGRLVG